MIQAPFSGEISFWNQDVEYPIFLLPEVEASSDVIFMFHAPAAPLLKKIKKRKSLYMIKKFSQS